MIAAIAHCVFTHISSPSAWYWARLIAPFSFCRQAAPRLWRASGHHHRAAPPPPPLSYRQPPASGVRQGIIIVATLVDKLPNLAGLARTCEVRDLGEGVQLEGACLWEGGPCPISAWKPQDSLYLLTVSDHESFDCLAPQVFRASLLVVPDLRVASDPAFSAISVTAEQWVPMAEVTEGALLPWLERKQAQG